MAKMVGPTGFEPEGNKLSAVSVRSAFFMLYVILGWSMGQTWSNN